MIARNYTLYMPPESRGAMIRSIVDACNKSQNANNYDLKCKGAFLINELLATAQSQGHLDNTLDRVNIELGPESGRQQGIRLVNSVVSGTQYAGCVDRCSLQMAAAAPLLGRAFLRNDEPEFRIAQFPLHHSAYSLT